MARLTPDPTFYSSPSEAAAAAPEDKAYVVTLNADGNGKPDALSQLDLQEGSSTYGQLTERLDMPALIVWGEHDSWFPAAFADRYCERFQNAAIWLVNDAGRWPWLERPEIAERIAEFVAGA